MIEPLRRDIDRRIEGLGRDAVILQLRPQREFPIATRAVGSLVTPLHPLRLAEDRLVLARRLHERGIRLGRVVYRIKSRQRPVASECGEVLDEIALLRRGELLKLGDARLEVLRHHALFGQHLHRAREASNLGIDPNPGQLLVDLRDFVEQPLACLRRDINVRFQPLQTLHAIGGEGAEIGKLLQFEPTFARAVPRRMNLLHVAEATQIGLQPGLSLALLADPLIEFALLAEEFTVTVSQTDAARRLTRQFLVPFEQAGDHLLIAAQVQQPLQFSFGSTRQLHQQPALWPERHPVQVVGDLIARQRGELLQLGQPDGEDRFKQLLVRRGEQVFHEGRRRFARRNAVDRQETGIVAVGRAADFVLAPVMLDAQQARLCLAA